MTSWIWEIRWAERLESMSSTCGASMAATWPHRSRSSWPTAGGCSPRPTRRAAGLLHHRGGRARRGCAEPGAVAVPEVLAPSSDEPPSHLVLEWIDEGARRPSDRGRARPGPGRACTRPAPPASAARTAAPPAAGACPNEPCDDVGRVLRHPAAARRSPGWPRDGRRARRRRHRRPRAPRADRLASRSAARRSRRRACTATCGPATGWSTPTGRSWLIDPAAHGGHREFDLAMMRLFGGFGAACFAAYAEAPPARRRLGGPGAAAPDRPARRARHQVRRRLRPGRRRRHRPLRLNVEPGRQSSPWPASSWSANFSAEAGRLATRRRPASGRGRRLSPIHVNGGYDGSALTRTVVMPRSAFVDLHHRTGRGWWPHRPERDSTLVADSPPELQWKRC